MGVSNSVNSGKLGGLPLPENLLKDWTTAQQPQDALFPNISPYRTRLLYNIVTHEYLQQYSIYFSSEEEYQAYQKILEWRLEQDRDHSYKLKSHFKKSSVSDANLNWNQLDVLPKIKFFADTSTHQLCSTAHSGSIYFDKIEIRLKDINDIPLKDMLYMYERALIGFQILVKKFGTFVIEQQMVFIDKQGKVTVWIHPNLSMHDPLQSYHETKQSKKQKYEYSPLTEGLMVFKLIKLIEQNVDSDEYTHNNVGLFSEYLTQKLCGVKVLHDYYRTDKHQPQKKSPFAHYDTLQDKIENEPKCLSFQSALQNLQAYKSEYENFDSFERMESVHELYESLKQEKQKYFIQDSSQSERKHKGSEVDTYRMDESNPYSKNQYLTVRKQAINPNMKKSLMDDQTSKVSKSSKNFDIASIQERSQSNMPQILPSNNISTYRLKIKQKSGDANAGKGSRRVNTEYQIQYKEEPRARHQELKINNIGKSERMNQINNRRNLRNHNAYKIPNGKGAKFQDRSAQKSFCRHNTQDDESIQNQQKRFTHKYYTKPSTPILQIMSPSPGYQNRNQIPLFLSSQATHNIPNTNHHYNTKEMHEVRIKQHKKNNTCLNQNGYAIKQEYAPTNYHQYFNAQETNMIYPRHTAFNTVGNSVKVSRLHSEQPRHLMDKLERQHQPIQLDSSKKVNFIFSSKEPQEISHKNLFALKSFKQRLPHERKQNTNAKNILLQWKEKDIPHNSNIKYYTSNESYQLDQQIADDLEKMLEQTQKK